VRAGPQGNCVDEIKRRLKMPGSTLSHHLDALTRSGLLAARRSGRFRKTQTLPYLPILARAGTKRPYCLPSARQFVETYVQVVVVTRALNSFLDIIEPFQLRRGPSGTRKQRATAVASKLKVVEV
jgi:DNA-binding transcriptional ArsR family regulator